MATKPSILDTLKNSYNPIKNIVYTPVDMSGTGGGNNSDEVAILNIEELTKNVVTDTTDWTVSGEGWFDIMMTTATKHLKAQFEANRIREEDYANAYVDIFKAVLAAMVEAWTKKPLITVQMKEIEAKTLLIPKEGAKLDAEKAVLEAQYDSVLTQILRIHPAQEKLLECQAKAACNESESQEAQKIVHLRQAEAFREDFRYKIFKALLDTYGVMYASAADNFSGQFPVAVTTPTIDRFFKRFIVYDLEHEITPTAEEDGTISTNIDNSDAFNKNAKLNITIPSNSLNSDSNNDLSHTGGQSDTDTTVGSGSS